MTKYGIAVSLMTWPTRSHRDSGETIRTIRLKGRQKNMKAINTTGSAGKAYGHVPGHQYHDVDVTIRRTRNGRWSVEVLETWGGAQGYDEEHGRKKVIGRGDDLADAVRDARQRAKSAGIGPDYVEEALSEAEEKATAEAEAADVSPLADTSTADLEAELARRRAAK